MKWQIDEIMKMETHCLNPFSEELVSRADVIALLSRKCADCKYHTTETEVGRSRNRTLTYHICTNAVGKKGWRYTFASNDACTRFERGTNGQGNAD